jgi:hypothetical protein
MPARPLLGMPLTTLDLNYTYAKDLWPLRNMPLERLRALTGKRRGLLVGPGGQEETDNLS